MVSAFRGEDLGCPDCSLGAHGVISQIFEPLLKSDLVTGAIIPGEGYLAETWSVNDDFTEYTFKIREGVQFHQGWGEMTTEDVEFSWDLMVRTGTTSPRASAFGPFTLVVVDKYTFKLTSDVPKPDFIPLVREYPNAFAVTSKAYWETVGDEAARLHPIGAGPFQFKEHIPGVSMVFEKFEDHYRQVPLIDEFEYLVAPEFNTRFELLKAGDVSLMIGSYDQVEAAKDEGLNIITLTMQRNPTIYLPFYQTPQGPSATDPPPWDSNVFGESGTLVRRALSLLIDRQEIVDFVLFGLGTVEGACVQSWWPKDPGYDHDCVPDPYDPVAALALLNQAGYDDFSDLSITVDLAVFPSFPACGVIVQAVAQQWINAGVDVTTQRGDYGVVVEENTSKREANYAFCYATPAFASAVQLWSFYSRTTDRLSYSGETPEIDKLIGDALVAEATPGQVQEDAGRLLFDHAQENALGLPVSYADFIFFADPCLDMPLLPGDVAARLHNLEFSVFTC